MMTAALVTTPALFYGGDRALHTGAGQVLAGHHHFCGRRPTGKREGDLVERPHHGRLPGRSMTGLPTRMPSAGAGAA
jgi:hypothetical protein